MRHATITTELIRQLRHQAPVEVTDYRDPKLPGFVLRARPTGIHSWRVQLPNRRWLTDGGCPRVVPRELSTKRACETYLEGRLISQSAAGC